MINIIIHFEAHCQIRTQKSKKRKIAEFSPIRYHTHTQSGVRLKIEAWKPIKHTTTQYTSEQQ